LNNRYLELIASVVECKDECIDHGVCTLQKEEADDELQKIPKDLWAVKQFDKKDYWFLQTG